MGEVEARVIHLNYQDPSSRGRVEWLWLSYRVRLLIDVWTLNFAADVS